jgi:DNA-binding transcriptional LysR family regulator
MSKLRQVSDLDLRLLRSFAEIVDRGGFAAAQASLNISQSVMSEHLKTLEVRLGFTLCKRGPGGFKLLPDGERVYKASKQLFAAIEDFKLDIGEIGDEMSGEVTLAVEDEIVTNPACRLPEALRLFGQRVGNRVRLRIENMVGYQAISRVADGTAHLGISLSDARARDLYAQPLFEEVVELYCGIGHPLFDMPDREITEAVLASYPYSSRGHLEPKVLLSLAQDYRRGDTGIGSQAHLALVLSGRDVGYLSQHLAAPFVDAKRLRAVRTDITRHHSSVQVIGRDSSSEGKLVSLLRSCLVMAHAPGATAAHRAGASG